VQLVQVARGTGQVEQGEKKFGFKNWEKLCRVERGFSTRIRGHLRQSRAAELCRVGTGSRRVCCRNGFAAAFDSFLISFDLAAGASDSCFRSFRFAIAAASIASIPPIATIVPPLLSFFATTAAAAASEETLSSSKVVIVVV